jgi:hypothetical protein
VSLGVLARSGQSTGQEASTAQNNAFVVLDQNVAIGANGNLQGFIRQVVTQEVAIRNALGERVMIRQQHGSTLIVVLILFIGDHYYWYIGYSSKYGVIKYCNQ